MGSFTAKIATLQSSATRLRLGAHQGSSHSPSNGLAVRPFLPFSLALFTDERLGDITKLLANLPHSRRQNPQTRQPLAIIFRHYQAPARVSLALHLAKLARQYGHLFLVAGNPQLAWRCRADGFHLPESQLPQLPGLRHKHPQWLITTACHSAQALRHAAQGGADGAFLSPVFPTKSHPKASNLRPVGFAHRIHMARRAQSTELTENIKTKSKGACRQHTNTTTPPMPVLALGGVDLHTLRGLTSSPAAGFGAIGTFME